MASYPLSVISSISPLFLVLDSLAISSVKYSVAQNLNFPTKKKQACSVFLSFPTLTIPPEQQLQPQKLPPRREDVYESSAGDSEDDYVQQRPQGKAVKKRLSKTRSRKRTGDKDDQRPVQRKRRRVQPTEVDLSELPVEQGLYSIFPYTHSLIIPPSQQNSSRHANRSHPET